MAGFSLYLIALLSKVLLATAAFSSSAKNNVAIYWGQGPYQARLVETCKNPNVDIVIVGFINVFPGQPGSAGYPGSDFGNACSAEVYKNKNGKPTKLLSGCTYIGPDITTCQKTYGKKVLLSLGGGGDTSYFVGSNDTAINFATFLWNAFGPVTPAWTKSNGPRPFGKAVVDGFDFDIESDVSPPPTFNGAQVKNYKTRGYVKMIQTFRQVLFKKDTSKPYYISGAPQCIVPDAHFADAVQRSWFDFLFIQFYNTPTCSARAGVNRIEGASSVDISYNQWSKITFFNKNIKLFIGLPASTDASSSYDYYLPPQEADLLIRKFYSNGQFGGIMLWEATRGANNVVCGKNYPTWMKKLLNAVQQGRTLNTTTDDCPNPKVPCGNCPAMPVSPNGNCGPNYGFNCTGSAFGQCCSADGKCSNTVCGTAACDSNYGSCDATTDANSRKLALFKRQELNETISVSASATADTTSTPASEQPLTTEITPTTTPAADIRVGDADSTSTADETTTTDAGLQSTTTPAPASSPSLSATPAETSSISAFSSETVSPVPSTTSEASFTISSTSTIESTLRDAGTSDVPTSAPSIIAAAAAQNSVDAGTISDSTSAPASETSASSTSIGSKITKTITIYSTFYQTITDMDTTTVVTSLVAISTTLVDFATETPAPAPLNPQVAAAVSADPTPAQITHTVVVTATEIEVTTITLPRASSPTSSRSRITVTHTLTDYYTSFIPLLAAEPSLYNPHSNETSTRTTVHKVTATYFSTVTISGTSPAQLTQTVEVVPLAAGDPRLAIAVGAGARKQLVTGGAGAVSNVTATYKPGEPSVAAVLGAGQTSSAGRLSARRSGPGVQGLTVWSGLAAVLLLM